MFLKLFVHRHYSSVTFFTNTPSKESEIIHLCRSGLLSQAIKLLKTTEKISSKPIVYATLIQTCTKSHSFNHGVQFHTHVIKTGLETDRFVGNSLLALYFKLGSNFLETRRFFDGMVYKDVVAWSSMITGYVRIGKPKISLELYGEMIDMGFEPNGFTLSAVIKACSDIGKLKLGSGFHGVVISRGFEENNVIVSALIDMYGKNYASGDALKLFDELPEPDAVCWTSVISSLTRNELHEEALGFFYTMHKKNGLAPDLFTFGSVLTALGNSGRTRQGRQVHAKIVTAGLCGNVIVDSSLVDMYAKCGLVDVSQRVFDRMDKRNSVSWCALMGGYCQKGEFDIVIELFRTMGEVDLYCFGTVLRACAGLAALKSGKEVHCQYLRRGGWSDVIVESALVDLYAKCGFDNYAYVIFRQMNVRNSVTWNSMISGFAQNGKGAEAIAVFKEMISEGVKPDYISFIAVLFACSHNGMVDEGRKYYLSMINEYGIKAHIEHYSCMVDLLGRVGEVEEAESLILGSEFRNDASLWATLLGACTSNTNPTVAERIAKKMMELNPDYHLSYVLLANVYRAVGRWADALEIRRQMQEKRVNKITGKSWI
ncbi:pentatricopeptide repeat-containing protein At1g03540 [Solanum pennellii]|uniref:Pentatricopeptide repeat-containing protein At1g03540 n=1 Tax=Solanum pennellii TaxID=28526 RepID=A0ABM1HS26_SOLPN|nr:pentatricopeptide repeat-containing protein At1g03540 [Solanum pennellii]